MKNYHDPSCRLTRVPTLAELDKFEEFQKINISKGDRRGQAHRLSINEKNKFNQIKEQLEEIEPFINKTNQYFAIRQRHDLEENEELSKSEDEEKQNKLNKRIRFTVELERLYKNTVHRILDDLYHLTVTTNFPQEDSERFIKKIIELKTRLAYHEWTFDIENSFFNLQVAHMRQIQWLIKQDGLEEYFEEKNLKGKFIDPLNARIDNIKQILSN